ncbi:MAG TPA: hypothetical protein VFE47_10235 [Tepidisphaeraceae bacterium]|jgi:hypothetical protein|nr:hypothetical protein [Tepidisphaeraceae bacterium]
MVALSESVTFTIPRSAVGDMLSLSASMIDRMHELLERNTDGRLSPLEEEELQTLVQMSQFGQIVSLALQAQLKP